MTKNYKLLAVLLASASALNLSAACGSSQPLSAVATFSWPTPALSGTVGTDVTAQYWALGATANNSGTCLSTDFIFDDGGGNRALAGDWGNGCNVGCATSAMTTAVLVNRRINEGAANHAGQFVIARVGFDNGTLSFNTDLITGGTMPPATIPTLTVCTQTCAGATYNHATGAGNVVVSFTQPNVNGFSTPTAAAGPVITGYEVYQINGTAAPTTSNVASWGSALTQATPITCGAGTCSGVVTLTTIPNVANTRGYLALRLVADGGFARTAFVGGNSAPIAGPLAVEGIPTSIELYPTRVNNLPGFQVRWTSTNESEIAGYKVMASSNGSNWVVVQDNIATKGPGTYTQSISRRTVMAKAGSSTSYQIKVLVVKRDGSTADAGPSTYTWNQAEPRGGK